MISGGEVWLEGKKFFIDKNLTNPKNIGYPEYFISDEIKNIAPEAKAQLPAGYIKEIEGIEKFIDATKRIMKPLSKLKKINDKSYRVIIVTHDALTGFIANVFSGGEQGGLNPGEFINLERKERKLAATKVGELKEGKLLPAFIPKGIVIIGAFDYRADNLINQVIHISHEFLRHKDNVIRL